jgi:hypothetical protein
MLRNIGRGPTSRRRAAWVRGWKLELIERDKLGWRELAEDLDLAPPEPTGFPRSRG